MEIATAYDLRKKAIFGMNYIAIPGLKSQKKKELSANFIIKTVCEYYKQRVGDVLAKWRKRELITCRHVCTYLIRKHLRLGVVEIGKIMWRDHTTSINSIQVVEGWLSTDPELAKQIIDIEMKLF